jgi:histidinol-phosphate aminotransferase
MRLTHPDFATAFNKIRNHFGLGRLAQAAALAALADQDYLIATVARIAAARDRIAGNRARQRPDAAAFCDQFRHHRLRWRRGFRACGSGRRSSIRGLSLSGCRSSPRSDRCDPRVSCGPDADLLDVCCAATLPKALAAAMAARGL